MRCRELARDHLDGKVVTDEQCQACLDYVPKKRFVKSSKQSSKYSSHLRFSTITIDRDTAGAHGECTQKGDVLMAALDDSSIDSMRWTSTSHGAEDKHAFVDLTAFLTQGLVKSIVVADTGANAHIFNDKRWFLSLEETHNAKISGVGGTLQITRRGMTVFGMVLPSAFLGL